MYISLWEYCACFAVVTFEKFHQERPVCLSFSCECVDVAECRQAGSSSCALFYTKHGDICDK